MIQLIDLVMARKLQQDGIVSIQKHPSAPLLILNYTSRCQYDWAWDDFTSICRGLIVDIKGNIIARPFPKFFNIEEHEGSDSKLPKLNWNQKFDASYIVELCLIVEQMHKENQRMKEALKMVRDISLGLPVGTACLGCKQATQYAIMANDVLSKYPSLPQ